jgi:UDP-N-acetylglucosamine 2-epimerase (non-hydrolysing)
MHKPKVLFIFGTRPEAIKLCPLVRYLRESRRFQVRVCVTAQHRALLDEVLAVFDVAPDHDLAVMQSGQTLTALTGRILAGLEPVIASEAPDISVVQGDTTTAFAGALASFYADVPVAHVEAGLRTGDLRQPFPEELNRVLISRLASLHFAATAAAAANLTSEGVPRECIAVTGNSGVDAVLDVSGRLARGTLAAPRWERLRPETRLIAVTTHRRESFGDGIERICTALRRIAELPGVQIALPVHPNPNVNEPVRRRLGNIGNIALLEPLDYVSFVDLLRRAYLIVSDSGGIQEEAPSLGKPVLVLREKTERTEAVEAGTAILVGTDVEAIVGNVRRLLDCSGEYRARQGIANPYGDGTACRRIAEALTEYFSARRVSL